MQVYESRQINSHKIVKIDSLSYHYSDSSFINRVGVIDHWHHYILVEDQKKHCLWVFDDSLHHIKTLGRRGRGPGEFSACDNILLTQDSLYIWDRVARRISVYDTAFQFIRSFSSPPDIIPQLSLLWSNSKILRVGKNLILSWINLEGKKQANTGSPSYLKKNQSLCILDTNFQYQRSFFPWADIYFSEQHSQYASQANIVSLEYGIKNTFFAQQHADWHIVHFDSNFSPIVKFGRQPRYFQSPPNDANAPAFNSSNPQKYYEFLSNCSYFRALEYDTTQHFLVHYYSTLAVKSWKTADIITSDKHFLQVFDAHYDCVLDETLSGVLKFVYAGKIYVLTEDSLQRFTLTIFQIQKL